MPKGSVTRRLWLEGKITKTEYYNYLAQRMGLKDKNEYQEYCAQKCGFKDYKEYREYLTQRKGFENRIDVRRKTRHVIRAMVQIGQDYAGYMGNKLDAVAKLYEQYKDVKLHCACCPPDAESQQHEEFLTIDHIHNNGADHRRNLGVKSSIVEVLFRNGFKASDYQLLCWNCNIVLANYGYCPHHPEIVRETNHERVLKTNMVRWSRK